MRVSVIFLCVFSLSFFSCEDVIDVEVPTTEPRLIVNGVLRVDESQQFIPVEIKVTETTNFFEDNPVTELESAIIFYGQPNPDAPEILENLAVHGCYHAGFIRVPFEPSPSIAT